MLVHRRHKGQICIWTVYRVAQIKIPQQNKFDISTMGKDFWIKFSAPKKKQGRLPTFL